jgi:ribosomal protein S18 acetylase RimI-like enzyme
MAQDGAGHDDPGRRDATQTRGGGSPTTVQVRPGTASDAGTAADLHAGQISQGFLAVLGPRFLARLYRRISLDPGSFLIVGESDGATVGFIAGSTDVGRLYRAFLVHDGVAAALGSCRHLISRWRQVVETLRHGSGGAGTGRGAELLAVAVDGSFQGKGAGWSLVNAFLSEVSARGGDAAHVVVGAENAAAVSLYRRAGFGEVERFELHSGTQSLLMQWDRNPTT